MRESNRIPHTALSPKLWRLRSKRRAARRELLGAESVQPAFVGIMSNGTSGDVNNINVAAPVRAHRAVGEQISIVADSVAHTVLDAVKNIAYQDWVPLAVAFREIELGVRRPSPEQVARAHNVLAKAKGPVLAGLDLACPFKLPGDQCQPKITDALLELLAQVAKSPAS